MSAKETVSIEGKLLMMDNATPHVCVPVQAICEGQVIQTTLSDDGGVYRFVNLEPGLYQLRCQVLGGYIHHEVQDHASSAWEQAAETDSGQRLKIERGKTIKNIDFHFPPFKKGIWRNYDTLDGLTHNNIWAMYIDPDGVMWFGTYSGVSRYDGKKFTNFSTRDGLPGNNVFTICGDLNGAIWFGTYGDGLCRYDGKEFVTFTEKDGLAGNTITGASCAPDGDLWFGTHSGVSRYDGKGFVTFTEKDGLAHDVMHTDAIHCDPDGVVWLGTQAGLSRYDGKEFVNLTFDEGSDENWNFIHSVYRDRDGFLWIGTRSGVLRYDGQDFVKFAHKDGLPGALVVHIYQDFDGSMWFGIAYVKAKASWYDGKTFVNFTEEDGLAPYDVTAIHRGPDGALWFATNGGGVSIYSDSEIAVLNAKDGLASNYVQAIYHDERNGNMWIGTLGGVSLYDGKQFTSFTEDDGLVNNQISTICQDLDGLMWFGTNWWGVSQYDGRRFTGFEVGEEDWYNSINAIYRGPDGDIWFATGSAEKGGLTRYDGRDTFNFTREHGLVDDCVLSIHATPDGAIWAGTPSGLSRYDGKGFSNFTTEDGLVDNWVNAIHCDPDGVMWFGTSCGASRYDGKEFTSFTIHDGLAHDSVMTIYRASDGIIWFGTNGGGACMYDGTAWSSLDTRDGLGSNAVYIIQQGPDGSMWLGTGAGLARYRRNHTPPEVRIASVTIDRTYRDLSAIPELTVGQRITIEYSSLDLRTVPQKQQYRCQAFEKSLSKKEIQAFGKGLSEKEMNSDWQSPTRETSFDWTPNKTGTYTFAVQAIDRDLNYSAPATLGLTVKPDPMLIELSYLRRAESGKYRFENIIGHSPAIRQVRALMERAIDSGLTVLIIGETGTGKELVAKAIHYNSQRKGHPLLDRNCGAMPKELLASDLFGHRKGAFTGATEDNMGLFEAASGGTLLLDEIGEMPQDTQIHLLRVLEERKIQRLGEHTSRDVDVRIIAMTNRDLIKELGEGHFREDLYYRLSEFPIRIPPLRERKEDIPLLAEHFLKEIDRDLEGFAPGVFEMLQSYAWPGNVRELRNVIRRAAALAEEREQIQAYHFPSEITHGESMIQEILSERVGLSASVEALQRRMVEDALKQCNGNRSQAREDTEYSPPQLHKAHEAFWHRVAALTTFSLIISMYSISLQYIV